MVLSRLVSNSDVVLMDLRGFSSQNMGCIFEIKELINAVTLGQMAFIIDDTTDELFLRQVVHQAWDQMSPTSPNRQLTTGLLSLVRLRRLQDDELKQLLHTLSIASSSRPQAQALA